MGGESLAAFPDRFNKRLAEFFALKMRSHGIDKPLPELSTAFFVNGFVAYDGKIMCARRDENKYGIALARFVHTEPMKFPLRRHQWIARRFTALNINADLTGRF